MRTARCARGGSVPGFTPGRDVHRSTAAERPRARGHTEIDMARPAPLRFLRQARVPCRGGPVIAGIARLIVFVLDTAVTIPIVLAASLADRDAKAAYHVARVWA